MVAVIFFHSLSGSAAFCRFSLLLLFCTFFRQFCCSILILLFCLVSFHIQIEFQFRYFSTVTIFIPLVIAACCIIIIAGADHIECKHSFILALSLTEVHLFVTLARPIVVNTLENYIIFIPFHLISSRPNI